MQRPSSNRHGHSKIPSNSLTHSKTSTATSGSPIFCPPPFNFLDSLVATLRICGLPAAYMASSRSASTTPPNSKKRLGFVANALKQKDSFIQLFAMAGILLLSMRSLGQKYKIHDLQEDTSALKQENQNLTDRMKNIKSSLLHEASLDSTGLFASRLRVLFGEDK